MSGYRIDQKDAVKAGMRATGIIMGSWYRFLYN